MKKQLLILVSLLCTSAVANIAPATKPSPTIALTTGAVAFHNDANEWAPGVSALTVDWCYPFSYNWAAGAKASYLFFPHRTWPLHLAPITGYVRGTAHLQKGLQLYGSLGAGVGIGNVGGIPIWTGAFPVGEAEIGLNYAINDRTSFTAATRYLFSIVKAGILDFRVGVSFKI